MLLSSALSGFAPSLPSPGAPSHVIPQCGPPLGSPPLEYRGFHLFVYGFVPTSIAVLATWQVLSKILPPKYAFLKCLPPGSHLYLES